jgi:hypothetical protein
MPRLRLQLGDARPAGRAAMVYSAALEQLPSRSLDDFDAG